MAQSCLRKKAQSLHTDLLSNLVHLQWEHCNDLPNESGTYAAKCVWHKSKLYIGGGFCSASLLMELEGCGNFQPDCHPQLLIYTPTLDSWKVISTPTKYYSLVVYHSKLVLVGGQDTSTDEVSSKIWLLNNDKWIPHPTIPDMPPCRSTSGSAAVSFGNHLIVAGSDNDVNCTAITVFNGKTWLSGESIPQRLSSIQSVANGDDYYLSDGEKIYRTSLRSLIASLYVDTLETVWEKLPNAPYKDCSITFLGNYLLAVGGYSEQPFHEISAIYAYNRLTDTWEIISEIPCRGCFSSCCTVLPTGELLVVGGWDTDARVLKAKIKEIQFPDDLLSMNALEYLCCVGHVNVFQQISLCAENFIEATCIESEHPCEGKHLLETWIGQAQALPTWSSLLSILKQIDLNGTAQQIENFFSAEKTINKILKEVANAVEVTGEKSDLRKMKVVLEKIEKLRKWLLENERNWTAKLSHLSSRNERLQEDLKSIYEKIAQTVVRMGEEAETQHKMAASVPLKVKQESFDYKQKLIKTEEYIAASCSYDVASSQENLGTVEEHHQHECCAHLEELEHYEQENSCLTSLLHESLEEIQRQGSEKSMPVSDSTPAVPTATTMQRIGVDILAETKLLVTNESQSFHWAGYGVKFHFPENCLPCGVKHCSLQIQASLSGFYKLPSDTALVSTVYWIKSTPKITFKQPITLEIQSCAKPANVSRLLFLKAHSSPADKLPYDFLPLESGVFSAHTAYGSIQLDHFCGLAVGQKDTDERNCCTSLFYLGDNDRKKRIDFVVMWNLDAYITAVLEEYAIRKAVVECDNIVEFEAEQISLEIQDGGFEKDGWRLTTIDPPTVEKSQVDNFKPGQVLPRCRLLLKYSGPEDPPDFEYRLMMNGAKKPKNFVTIFSELVSPVTASQSLKIRRKQKASFKDPPASNTPRGKHKLVEDSLPCTSTGGPTEFPMAKKFKGEDTSMAVAMTTISSSPQQRSCDNQLSLMPSCVNQRLDSSSSFSVNQLSPALPGPSRLQSFSSLCSTFPPHIQFAILSPQSVPEQQQLPTTAQSFPKSRPSTATVTLDISDPPTLKDLVVQLNKIAARWYKLGLQMGIEDSELDKIKYNLRNEDCESMLSCMLQTWLRSGEAETHTWIDIADAVDMVDSDLATKIRNSVP